MASLSPILCPVDFSEQSRQALRVAGMLANRYDSRLIVLTVVDSLLAEAARVRLGIDLAKEETDPALVEFVKDTWPQGTLRRQVQLAVRVGEAADAIVNVASANAVALIVMGTRGLGGLRKWLLGSTAEHVLRQSRTPVLAVPPTDDRASAIDGNPFGTGPALAATDFKEPAAAAVRFTARFAVDFNLPLVLAHVVEPVSVPPQWSSYAEDSNETRVRDARARLEQIKDQLGDAPAVETIVTLGNPEEAIAAIADDRRAGLIAVGITGEEEPFARRPGSIAYSVLTAARVPVLVVPGPQKPA